uniref:Uncharacterized protein n=1 Tax=Arundo donax TaxID=35708 RepID=A0A0A9DP75_ARUDO
MFALQTLYFCVPKHYFSSFLYGRFISNIISGTFQ